MEEVEEVVGSGRRGKQEVGQEEMGRQVTWVLEQYEGQSLG